jgi:hypothetical protein
LEPPGYSKEGEGRNKGNTASFCFYYRQSEDVKLTSLRERGKENEGKRAESWREREPKRIKFSG